MKKILLIASICLLVLCGCCLLLFLIISNVSNKQPLFFTKLSATTTFGDYQLRLGTGISNTEINVNLEEDCTNCEPRVFKLGAGVPNMKSFNLISPEYSVFQWGASRYLLLKYPGGTQGYGSIKYRIFVMDTNADIKEIEVADYAHTCLDTVPYIDQKSSTLVFPKDGKCSDLGFNWDDYFAGSANTEINLGEGYFQHMPYN